MIKKINSKNFGELLKEVRKLNGITQNQLAKKSGISSETIRRIETQFNIPKIDVIDNLSRVLKTDLQLLFLELKKVNPLADFYLHLDELIMEYNIDALTEISREFYEIKTQYEFDSVLEKNDIDQLEFIVKGITQSYKSMQKGSQESLDNYLSAIKLTIPEFKLENYSKSKYNYIELKCLLLIALECNALSRFELSNDISIFLIKQIDKYNLFHNLDNTDMIKIKVIQNIAYNYHCLDNDKLALNYAQEGIDLCIQNKSLYMLFALYYRKATALYYLNKEKSEAIKNFKLSISVLEILRNDVLKDKFIQITEEKYNIRL